MGRKVEASNNCDSCGEGIVVPIDLTAGSSQEYVEDCPVCCPVQHSKTWPALVTILWYDALFKARIGMVGNKRIYEPDDLPNHESPVRRLYSYAHGLPYRAVRSLDEAKSFPDGIVVMEWDWGGQIYVVCPARLVKCNEEALTSLLRELDAIAWDCNDGDGARVYFERAGPGSGIAGGMGGGVVTDKLWIHQEFVDANLADRIQGRIFGQLIP